MKTPLLVAVLIGTAVLTTFAQAQAEPKMKMTTEIPPQLTTPDSVETRLGTLKFFDGFPDDQTVDKVMDNLDFSRGVQAFLSGLPGSSLVGMRAGLGQLGANNNTVAIFENLIGPTAPAGHEANWVQDHSRQRLERPPSPLRPAPAVVRQDVAAR